MWDIFNGKVGECSNWEINAYKKKKNQWKIKEDNILSQVEIGRGGVFLFALTFYKGKINVY